MADADHEIQRLSVIYDRVCHERDRLRDARGFFARGLGPAPASAGISTALVAALGDVDSGWVWAALILLALLIGVSIWYESKPAYRHLYAKKLAEDSAARAALATASPATNEQDLKGFYRALIDLEKDIYGTPQAGNRRRWPWDEVTDLQEGLDSERTGRRLVQLLWIGVIGALVVGTLT